MSYIQIELGGKPMGLKFNTMALLIFEKKFEEDEPATVTYALVWGGLKANAYVKGEEFLESFETVCDWVDKLSIEDQTAIVKAFNDTQEYKNLIKDSDEKDKKKLAVKSTKRNALKSH